MWYEIFSVPHIGTYDRNRMSVKQKVEIEKKDNLSMHTTAVQLFWTHSYTANLPEYIYFLAKTWISKQKKILIRVIGGQNIVE